MSSELNLEFEKNAAIVKTLKTTPNNDEKLTIYSLYKQATIGNNNKSKPWAYQLTEVAKWNAWSKLKDTDKDTAKKMYIKEVNLLVNKYGVRDEQPITVSF